MIFWTICKLRINHTWNTLVKKSSPLASHHTLFQLHHHDYSFLPAFLFSFCVIRFICMFLYLPLSYSTAICLSLTPAYTCCTLVFWFDVIAWKSGKSYRSESNISHRPKSKNQWYRSDSTVSLAKCLRNLKRERVRKAELTVCNTAYIPFRVIDLAFHQYLKTFVDRMWPQNCAFNRLYKQQVKAINMDKPQRFEKYVFLRLSFVLNWFWNRTPFHTFPSYAYSI